MVCVVSIECIHSICCFVSHYIPSIFHHVPLLPYPQRVCFITFQVPPSTASTATSLMAFRSTPHAVARWLPERSGISWLGAAASPPILDTHRDKHYLVVCEMPNEIINGCHSSDCD